MSRIWKGCAATAAGLVLLCSGLVTDAYSQRAGTEQGRPSSYIGCLRAQNDGSFELTEVGGQDVPDVRSWRTLYMTTSRELQVTAAGRIDLQSHVGTTVRITGERDGDRLRARSITFVGATCK